MSFSIALELIHLRRQVSPGFLSLLSCHWVTGSYKWLFLDFYMGSRVLNSDPHINEVRTFTHWSTPSTLGWSFIFLSFFFKVLILQSEIHSLGIQFYGFGSVHRIMITIMVIIGIIPSSLFLWFCLFLSIPVSPSSLEIPHLGFAYVLVSLPFSIVWRHIICYLCDVASFT